MEIDGTNLSNNKLEEVKRIPKEIVAVIRINPKSFTDAYVNNPDGGSDILIEGVKSRNQALEGDLVKVELNHHTKWRLNYNSIALRWTEWSHHLTPIIENLEQQEKQLTDQDENEISIKHEQDSPQNVINNHKNKSSPTESTRLMRKKRHALEQSDDKSYDSKLIQSIKSLNLPLGISKLKAEHILPLSFSSLCIQKTGNVTSIVKRNHSGIAGGFLKTYSEDFALFSPTDPRVPRVLIDIKECPEDFVSQPKRYDNVLFVAQIHGLEYFNNLAIGNLVKLVGDCNAIESRMEALLMEHEIDDTDFPPEVYDQLDYLNNLPRNWFEKNSIGRRDLTEQCIFTIDPKTARDLDDAVSIKQISEEIFEVGVHIADVSYFVKELSGVDYYARMRTTSVYLVDRVIPMLPRILCEKMCSLNPNEPKLTFSVIWKMNKYGHIIDQWFGRTIIKSCVKLAYEQAQDIIDNPDDVSWIQENSNMPRLYQFDWKRISKSVIMLNKIAKNMRAKRFEGGALRIEQVKMKFELDKETGTPTGFSFEQRNDANYLIEEFMLLANMSVAKKIYSFCGENTFLRRHPASSPKILKDVQEFCEAKGFKLDVTNAGSIQKSLNRIEDPTMLKVVSFLLLRAMKNAEYICVGSLVLGDTSFSHFALNVPFYTHFTSPIRRYADLIVHRQLSLALELEANSLEDIDSLSNIAEECTKRKQSAKLISEISQKLFFNLYVKKAGFCELLACVTKIYDKSFDVILVEYNTSGRVYLDRLQPELEKFDFEIKSGQRRLVLAWRPSSKRSIKRSKKLKKKLCDDDQAGCRSTLEAGRKFKPSDEHRINQSSDNQQVVEPFDIIKVIVTVDPNDITKLRIDLKKPSQ